MEWFYLTQVLHIVFFSMAILLPRWRNTGAILLGYAVLYIALMPLFVLLNDAPRNIEVYVPLTCAALDLSTVYLLLAKGSRGRLVQSCILLVFVTTHMVVFYDMYWDERLIWGTRYRTLTVSLQLLQVFAFWRLPMEFINALSAGISRSPDRGFVSQITIRRSHGNNPLQKGQKK